LPSEIYSAIQNLPEFQKEKAVENYKDIKIRWHLKLSTLNVKGDDVNINFRAYDPILFGVSCKVKVEDYPEIKVLKDGHGSWVSGKISEISFMAGVILVELSDTLLEID